MIVHTNPTKKRRHILDQNTGKHVDVQSHAPYNFVSLPEMMVEATLPLPSESYYSPDCFTGSIEVEIETCSPTYIRGMITPDQYEKIGIKKAEDLDDEDKRIRAPFYSSSTKIVEGYPEPVIPGSSLRGLVRTIVEVIGYGRMRWVSATPTFTYRAMAAESHDPLKQPYQDFMGNNARNVRVGYFEKENDQWFIRPAKTPKACGINAGRSDRYFLKVEDEDINSSDVPGFVSIKSVDYKPQIHKVRIERGNGEVPKRPEVLKKAKKDTKKTRPFWIVKSTNAKNLKFEGVLVCSGNMRETSEENIYSPRSKHYLIMPRDAEADRIPVPEQVIEDYRAGLTPYQKENLSAWKGGDLGCLGEDKPVFYVADDPDDPKEIRFFGHSPNFRVPALQKNLNRATTPLDFVPENIRANPNPDIADAIFGWVEEKDWGPAGQRAGRLFFEDALFVSAESGIWYSPEPITPKVLAAPKATTFQHYLVQDKGNGHDPDQRVSLAHYGTPQTETKIRGYKFYWHKGIAPDIQAKQDDVDKAPRQFIKIMPLKKGVKFKSRIRFENLRSEELGALLWALTLPVTEENAVYVHKLGMGKPLGMGAVKIRLSKPVLFLQYQSKTEKAYYQKLLDGTSWYIPKSESNGSEFIKKFEEFMEGKDIAGSDATYSETTRVKELLEMLKWHGDEPELEWLNLTQYLEIRHQDMLDDEEINYNEYKTRPVLPSPFGVWSKLAPSEPEEELKTSHAHRTVKQSHPGNVETGTVKFHKVGDGYGYLVVDATSEEVRFNQKDLANPDLVLKAKDKVRFVLVKKGERKFANKIEKID